MVQPVRDRRRELLDCAARLFAERGFHGTSTEDLGSAAGVSGPAVYKHFASKADVLSALLVGVSESLLDGGRAVIAGAPNDTAALRRLVEFHAEFALSSPDVVRVQDRDLASLPPDEERRVRRLQREYVEEWTAVLRRIDPARPLDVARTQVHAAFGLLNSTPHSARTTDRGAARDVLVEMALRALDAG